MLKVTSSYLTKPKSQATLLVLYGALTDNRLLLSSFLVDPVRGLTYTLELKMVLQFRLSRHVLFRIIHVTAIKSENLDSIV